MDILQQYDDQNLKQLPKTYFDLIHKIGSHGKYQKRVIWIFFLNYFITAILLMSTSFLFYNPKMDCGDLDLGQQSCEEFVCSLPENKTQKYQKIEFKSLAVQFGPFQCQKVNLLNSLRMSLYIGAMFGYILIPFITDNYGRKISIVSSWAISVVGIAILSLSTNIFISCVGLFLSGFGCEAGIRTIMAILGEIVEDTYRQKYAIFLSINFGLGQIFIGFIFYIIKDWRTIIIACCLIPGIIQLILIILYVEETPKFLLKKDKQTAMDILNNIAKINGRSEDKITENDITSVIESGVLNQQTRTPLSLCKYQSQRWNYIMLSLIFALISVLYYGPLIIIETLNMSIYFAQFVLGLSETMTYVICYFLIDKTPRKPSGYGFYGLSAICFFILILLPDSSISHQSLVSIFQLTLVFIARFCIVYYITIIFLYITEVFPLPLRSTAFGMISVCGAITSTASQVILTTLVRIKVDPMIVFFILSLISCLALYPLPETLGKKLQEKIPQQEQQRRLMSLRQSQNNSKTLVEIENIFESKQTQKEVKEVIYLNES